MEVLLMSVPCVCAPDGSGEHPIEIAIRTTCDTAYRKRYLQISWLRTPCGPDADVVERLGSSPTCYGAIDDIRRMLTGRLGGGSLGLPSSALTAAQHAEARRARRERGRGLDPWAPHTVWSRVQRRLRRTEGLLAPRLLRELRGTRIDCVDINLRLAYPQVQLSITGVHPTTIGSQAVYEWTPAAGWRLKLADGTPGSPDWANLRLERQLDRLLPGKAVRGAILLGNQEPL